MRPSDLDFLRHMNVSAGEKIGAGGFGTVYRGERHGVLVAVKVADAGPASSVEVKALERLAAEPAHPGVIRLFEHRVSSDGLTQYMVLEQGGRELFEVINSLYHGAAPEDEARHIARQLIDAVAHCHRRGVVHRDLKLENILLSPDMKLKLIDFGLSHAFDEQTATGEYLFGSLSDRVGSPSYVAPEVLVQRAYDGRSADVWSLGVILFALACGFFPFEWARTSDMCFERARSAQEHGDSTVHAVFAAYRRLPPVSMALSSLVDAMLAIDPMARLSLGGVATAPWFDAPMAATTTEEVPPGALAPGSLPSELETASVGLSAEGLVPANLLSMSAMGDSISPLSPILSAELSPVHRGLSFGYGPPDGAEMAISPTSPDADDVAVYRSAGDDFQGVARARGAEQPLATPLQLKRQVGRRFD